jgi:hypothetical protein
VLLFPCRADEGDAVVEEDVTQDDDAADITSQVRFQPHHVAAAPLSGNPDRSWPAVTAVMQVEYGKHSMPGQDV